MNESNNTMNEIRKQAGNANQLIEKLALPKSLDETAARYGALIRRRAIKSACDLLVALFMYAITGMSLRLLAASTAAMGIADMSDQAWQKKLYYAVHGYQAY